MEAKSQQCRTDDELVGRVVVGDLQAFDELVRRYRRAVVVVAKTVLGSQDAAEDVAQEAFLIAYKALPQLSDTRRFGGWLCAIARNGARRRKSESTAHSERGLSEYDHLLLRKSIQLAKLHEQERMETATATRIVGALNELPGDVAEPLRLFYLAEWSAQQIAEFLSLPLTTVKWRLHQGRKHLRQRLGDILEEDHV